uniref:Ribonuclease H-like domain-containing protein n=1 Tax=Tanacetum cinerariifolium TaxID=118510 RepID=A0A6L2KU65_TANCI|nr:ribonuclease H-like domain-containing protein [Tanacetum cinerariifolium]
MSYLFEYEEINGGYVAFGGDLKGGKITGKGKISTASKDETSEILKSFITCIENLKDLRVKVIRCDNGTEFKNMVMNQFCEMKGIKREFSVARTPPQNGVAERKNRTLIEAAKTMLVDSKLPTTFCRKHALSFMRPFGCPVKILNTIDNLEENLHVKFSKNTPNIKGSRPNWLFDRDALTKSMNYKPIVARNQSNGSAGKARVETVPDKDYILLPLWTLDLLFFSSSKDSLGDGFKPSEEEEKKDTKGLRHEESKAPIIEEPTVNQEKDSVNSTNRVNAVSSTINAASNEVNVVSRKSSIKLPDDLNMPDLEDISIFEDSNEDVFDAQADLNNMETTFQVSPIPITRIHKDYPVEQIIGDIHSAPQTRRMTKSVTGHEPKKQVWTLVDLPYGKRAIGKKSIYRNKKDKRGIVVTNKERLVAQGYTQEDGIDYDEVFALVATIEAIRLFLVYASFKDFVVYQMDVKSAFLYGKIKKEVYVCQPPGFEDPEFCDRVYKVEKVLYGLYQAPRACQDKYVDEILKKFGFSTVKTASTHMETLKPLLKDENAKDVDVHLYRLMIGSLIYLTSSGPDIMFAVCACARFRVTPKVSHLHVVNRIFRYLKGQPKLGLWYPKDSPFDLEAYTDSDYAGASLDRKSTTGGCQFLRSRLISWQCTKKTVVANSITKAEYVAAANCCGQVLWIQKQMLDYGYNFMNTKILIDNKSTIYIVKNPVFHSKTKHIKIRHHFIRDLYKKRLIQVIKIRTDHDVADLLTKAFDISTFYGLYINNDWNEVKQLLRMKLKLTLFWAPTTAKNINGEAQIHAKVDGKKVIISKATIRRDLKFEDEGGVDCLSNEVIFEQLPLTGVPKETVTDEALNDKMYESLERATTTATSLDASHDRINISKTQSKTTPNEPSSLGTSLGSGPKRQDTMEDTIAQTMFENKTKTAQLKEILSLKRRVKRLEKKKKSRNHGLKRLYKIYLSARVESSAEEQKDHGMYDDQEMFDSSVLDDEEEFLLKDVQDVQNIVKKRSCYESTTTIPKSSKVQDKRKGIMVEEPLKMKKNDQISFDEEEARRLQAEFDEQDKLAKEKAQLIEDKFGLG